MDAAHASGEGPAAGYGGTQIGRLVRQGPDGFQVFVVERPQEPASSEDTLWIVLDPQGHIAELAHSELLAVAKMHALILRRITAALGAGRALEHTEPPALQ